MSVVEDRAGDARRNHHPHRARRVELGGEIVQRSSPRPRRRVRERVDGGGVVVVDDALVAGAMQPAHDVRAHAAEADHAELHQLPSVVPTGTTRRPASAAPTIPARLPSSAICTSQPGLMRSRNWSACFTTPPPITISSGHSTVVELREVRVEPLGPLLPRELLARRGSRRRPTRRRVCRRPRCARAPSSGRARRRSNNAVPTPVPTVTIEHHPARAARRRRNALRRRRPRRHR